MNREIAVFSVLFFGLLLAQIFVFSHIMLFNVAMPIVFIYFIIRLPIGMSMNLLYTLSFFLGFLLDIFTDTPGVNSLSCTLLALCKTHVFYAYVPRDDKTQHILPCISTLGWGAYSKYLLTMIGIYSIIVFSVEYLSFADVRSVMIFAGSSTLLSFPLLMAVDSLVSRK